MRRISHPLYFLLLTFYVQFLYGQNPVTNISQNDYYNFFNSLINADSVHRSNLDAAHHEIVYWMDILILSNGDTVGHGTIFTLGKGTLPNGDYNFIATASNSMEAKLKHTTTLKTMEVEDETKG